MLHWLSKAVTAASVAAIPVPTMWRAWSTALAEANLEDPVLNQELEQFKNDCWQPAYSRLSRTNLASLTQAEKHDATWLGSEYLLGSGVDHDRYYSTVPNPQFAFDATRDAGYEAYQVEGGSRTAGSGGAMARWGCAVGCWTISRPICATR